MQTELLITDVTQMREGRVCVAGVTHKNQAVRLLLRSGDMLTHHLQLADQNIMRPRAVIQADIEPRDKCRPPHVEDHDWIKPGKSVVLRVLNEQSWYTVLERICSPSLEIAFGVSLVRNRRVAPDCGARSIGTICPVQVTRVHIAPDTYGDSDEVAIRVDFIEKDDVLINSIPVTDLTLHRYVRLMMEFGSSLDTLSDELSAIVERADVFLRVGLTRPYRRPDEHESWSYVQVNGIHSFPDLLNGEDLFTMWKWRSLAQPPSSVHKQVDDLPF